MMEYGGIKVVGIKETHLHVGNSSQHETPAGFEFKSGVPFCLALGVVHES